jgi:N-methylhydantoinase B
MISDPIEFELFKNSLFSIADEMALTIFRTTYSGVLKDNMDYSTAMFDGSGKLVAQGLTLPGHLGSMPTAMAAIRNAYCPASGTARTSVRGAGIECEQRRQGAP